MKTCSSPPPDISQLSLQKLTFCRSFFSSSGPQVLLDSRDEDSLLDPSLTSTLSGPTLPPHTGTGRVRPHPPDQAALVTTPCATCSAHYYWLRPPNTMIGYQCATSCSVIGSCISFGHARPAVKL